MSVVISLCDLTGNFVRPWVEAGYRAILVDPQHGESKFEDGVLKLPYAVDEAMATLGAYLRDDHIAFVAAFPPCTDMAVSGARWFETKRQADPLFQAKAVAVAEQCRTIGRLSGAPWLVENPVSVLSSAFGRPSHTFDPCDYTGYEPADNYTKKTCLWTGGGFVMPAPLKDESLGAPDDRIHRAAPGPERANFRSATPMGFARAVFAANGESVRPILDINTGGRGMSIEDGPTVTDVWVTRELCLDHDGYADLEHKEWGDPGHHVTTECLWCGAVREIQDNGR